MRMGFLKLEEMGSPRKAAVPFEDAQCLTIQTG